MLTLNVRFWDLLTDMNNRPMKEYGKTSAEHFRMRSFGAGFAQYSASRICTLFHSHSFLKIQPIALRFSLFILYPRNFCSHGRATALFFSFTFCFSLFSTTS